MSINEASRGSWVLVADENIPFVNELFGTFGEVRLRKGRDISAADVKEADILLVRSVTQVNASLLEGSRVKFVGTCTIGVDHLDTQWLESRGIAWSSAPGCNAGGVVQYVLSAMAILNLLQSSPKVAVVGCGNVGGRLYRTLVAMGFECIGVDPYQSPENIPGLSSFDSIYDCDLICVHTPLTTDGPHPTRHMFNCKVFSALKPGAVLLNAGRGPVINNDELCLFLEGGGDLNVVLDVWETEPAIHTNLFKWVKLASPHIAGYSFEGRTNGSLMIYEALAAFAQTQKYLFQDVYSEVKANAFGSNTYLEASSISEAILASYDLRVDNRMLESELQALPESFDMLRKTYRKRREPSHYNLHLTNREQLNLAEAIGFNISARDEQ